MPEWNERQYTFEESKGGKMPTIQHNELDTIIDEIYDRGYKIETFDSINGETTYMLYKGKETQSTYNGTCLLDAYKKVVIRDRIEYNDNLHEKEDENE